MVQEFKTEFPFISYLGLCTFLFVTVFFPMALLDARVSCYSYATAQFKKQYHSY